MGNNKYTLMIVSPKGSEAKKIILSPFLTKAAGIFFLVFLSAFSLLLYDYFSHWKEVIDMEGLLKVTRSQHDEIHAFSNKIAAVEGEIRKFQSMESQIKKEWKEIQEISKKTKLTPVNPVKKELIPASAENLISEGISILEEEKPEALNRVQEDLLALRKKTVESEKKLVGLKETLQKQRSVLLSTPSLWPVFGRISSGFGETRQMASSGGTKPHKGVDIAASLGVPVLAPANGLVQFTATQDDYGNLIQLEHGHGFMTRFGHLQKILVKTGKPVKKGDAIGTVGMTGFSNGPHLHYEIHMNGNPVNPYAYLTETP